MKSTVLLLAGLLFSTISFAQNATSDIWSNVPQASDDRYTNPKKPLYAGPNGWYNFGEIRAEGSANATLKFAYKGGFNETMGIFVLVDQGKLQTFTLDFGTEEPVPGTYQIGKEGNAAQKKVAVSFSDVANKKIKDWSGSDGSGSVTVSKINGFLYFKCRNVVLKPTGMNNDGNLKQPIKIGIEGAVKL